MATGAAMSHHQAMDSLRQACAKTGAAHHDNIQLNPSLSRLNPNMLPAALGRMELGGFADNSRSWVPVPGRAHKHRLHVQISLGQQDGPGTLWCMGETWRSIFQGQHEHEHSLINTALLTQPNEHSLINTA